MDMPRNRRLWEPGGLLSIVGRGHEGRPLFATDDDRGFFVERLGRVFQPGDVDLLGWALLINHDHLMIRVTDAAPERLFRRLNTAIGMRERRRRGDHGTVFQGRFWSVRCDKEGAAAAVPPAGEPMAPATSAARSAGSISRVHDERMDRQARLRLAGWRPDDLLGPVCAPVGAEPAAVLAGRRRPAECAARALISHVACDGAGISAEAVAELLGVSGTAVSHARVRGRALLAARGWEFDEVLSWHAP